MGVAGGSRLQMSARRCGRAPESRGLGAKRLNKWRFTGTFKVMRPEKIIRVHLVSIYLSIYSPPHPSLSIYLSCINTHSSLYIICLLIGVYYIDRAAPALYFYNDEKQTHARVQRFRHNQEIFQNDVKICRNVSRLAAMLRWAHIILLITNCSG